MTTPNQQPAGESPAGRPSPRSSLVSQDEIAKICPTCGVRYPAEFRVCPRDAVELRDADQDEDELVGTTIAQTYAIVRVIGEGGMGRVYEARHTRIGTKRFAIKMLHPEYARQPDVLSRFQREAEAAASIRSEHVVDVYDVHRTADGRPFIVGEYLEGKELAEYLADAGRLPVGKAVAIVRQLCKALSAAHAVGVVHRDMKPENVFLTGDLEHPVAKVIDFGISKVADNDGAALTKTGMIMGTPSYMSPEQARGDRVDHRTDIYAVGAILYCALTGRRPFDRGDPTSTLTAVLTEDPEPPTSLEPSIPPALELVISRAMAKEPAERYGSMTDLDRDLTPFDETALALSPKTAPKAEGGTAVHLEHARAIARARPVIALLTTMGIFWILLSVVTVTSAVLRIRQGQLELTMLEALIVSGLAIVGFGTPFFVGVRHVARKVWRNRARAVEVAEFLRRTVIVGLFAYGFAALTARLIEGVVLRRSLGNSWPMWDIVLAGTGIVAALLSWIVLAFEGRAARKAKRQT